MRGEEEGRGRRRRGRGDERRGGVELVGGKEVVKEAQYLGQGVI